MALFFSSPFISQENGVDVAIQREDVKESIYP